MKSIKSIYPDLCYIIGTFFGIGLIKYAPGTFASLVTALIWFLVPEYYFYNPSEGTIYYDSYLLLTGAIILFGWLAVHVSTVCEKKFGTDAGCIVIDEVFGYLVAILFLPKTPMVALYAFIMFRVFDISKPLFIKKIQDLPQGWGVMLDDIGAGIVSNILIQFLYIIKPEFFTWNL